MQLPRTGGPTAAPKTMHPVWDPNRTNRLPSPVCWCESADDAEAIAAQLASLHILRETISTIGTGRHK